MDPEILRLASLQAPVVEEDALVQRRGASLGALAKARVAKARLRAEREKDSQRMDPNNVVVAALRLLGATELLGGAADSALAPYRRKAGPLPLLAMCKLAVSAKVRGSGPVVDKVRRLQHISSAMLGASALHLQETGLRAWLLNNPPASDGFHRVLGFSMMWDEAEQKLKALLTKVGDLRATSTTAKRGPSTQTAVNVMACLGSVHQTTAQVDEHGFVDRKLQWQPRLAAPLFLTSTNKDSILEGLARSMPVDLTNTSEADKWCDRPNTFAVATLCFDFASSNVAALRHLGYQLEQNQSAFMCHGERCATHCVHLVKAGSLAASQLSGIL